MSVAEKSVIVGLFAVAIFGVGCPKGGLPSLDQFKPKLSFDGFKIKKASFKDMDLDFIFKIDNPNPIKVSIANFAYDFGLSGSPFLKGNSADGLDLKGNGESVIKIPLSLAFADVLKVAKGSKGKDEVPYTIKGNFGFQTPLGVVKIPYSEAGNLPTIRAPKVSIKKLKVDKLDLLKGTVDLKIDLGLKNSNNSNISFKALDYSLKLGGKNVADGLVEALGAVEPGQEQTVSLPVNLKLLSLGTAVVGALTNKSKIDVGIDAKANVNTPLGVLPLNISETAKLDPK